MGWTIPEACEVELHAHLAPGSKHGDCDHYISNLLDTMVPVVFTDDNVVTRIVATLSRDSEEEYVDIFVYPSLH